MAQTNTLLNFLGLSKLRDEHDKKKQDADALKHVKLGLSVFEFHYALPVCKSNGTKRIYQVTVW